MKNLFFLFALMVCSFKVSAQPAQDLVRYDFDDGTMNPTILEPSLVMSTMSVTNSNYVEINYPNPSMSTPSPALLTKNWAPPTIPSQSRYIQVAITAQYGKTVRLDEFKVYMMSTSNGPSYFSVRCSYDNYNNDFLANTVAIYDIPPISWQQVAAGTPYVVISDGSTATFRIYGYKSVSVNSIMAIDSITIRGHDETVSPLPIELLSFDAFQAQNDVKVEWSTASEQDNDHFIVERSEDMQNYQVVGIVSGAGNSQHRLDYSMIDPSPSTGWHYYRLTQVDHNGHREVFDNQVVPVYISRSKEIIFPNPANVGEIVHIPPETQVFDSSGRLLQSGKCTFTPTASGTYLVGPKKLVVR